MKEEYNFLEVSYIITVSSQYHHKLFISIRTLWSTTNLYFLEKIVKSFFFLTFNSYKKTDTKGNTAKIQTDLNSNAFSVSFGLGTLW